MRQILIFTLVALIGFTSCSKDEITQPSCIGDTVTVIPPPEDPTQDDETPALTFTGYSITNSGEEPAIVSYQNIEDSFQFFTLLPGESQSIVSVTGTIEFTAGAVVTVTEEALEAFAFSLKNMSSVFDISVKYISEKGTQETFSLSAGAITIIKAIPGSIKAPIDVLITELARN